MIGHNFLAGRVKSVVIDDQFGSAAELERQMHNIIGTYQCEWKITIVEKA